MRLSKPRRWGHWTLRSRLVLAIVLIAGAGLLAANLVASALVRSYLNDRLDRDVVGSASRSVSEPWPSRGFGGQGSDDEHRPPPLRDFGGVPTIIKYDASGNVLHNFNSSSEIISYSEAMKHADLGPFTATGSDGLAYRIAVAKDSKTGAIGVAAVQAERVEATADKVLVIGLIVSGIVLLLIALAASVVVKIGLRPLTRMEEAAALIAADSPPDGTTMVEGRVPDADPHTEPGRLGLALNTMLGRIEAALAARAASEQKLRQFLADASHELRTPLTSIRGFAELYRRSGSLNDEQLTEMMGRIEQEAARMGLLVEDLLLLAALDEERPLRAQPVDLLGVAADTIRDAHVRNPMRFVALTSFDPVTVIGDEHRLRQVVTNLVSNALRHTAEPAKVEVSLSEDTVHEPDPSVQAAVGAKLAPGTPVAVLTVADSGNGVPADVAPLIFERLYRVDSGRARSHGGSGLGLSIVAAIVGAHGGRVELTPTPGGGATFRVLLPL